MMMAVFSPKTHGVAFEDPQVIRADLVENGNVTAQDQDVTIFSNTMMKWRGECFITTGIFTSFKCVTFLQNTNTAFTYSLLQIRRYVN